MSHAVILRTGLMAVAVAMASGCEPTGICPLTPDSVETGTFRGIGEHTVVFTGYAIRYIDAPENPEARGYDLNVVRWLKGSPSPEGTFLRVTGEIEDIRGGQPVLIVGEPAARGPVITPGVCIPLIPISEGEVGDR